MFTDVIHMATVVDQVIPRFRATLCLLETSKCFLNASLHISVPIRWLGSFSLSALAYFHKLVVYLVFTLSLPLLLSLLLHLLSLSIIVSCYL